MEAPKEIYLPEADALAMDQPRMDNYYVKYVRSDLAVDIEKLIGYIDDRIKFLDKLLEANDSPVVFGKLSAFENIKDYIEKIKSINARKDE